MPAFALSALSLLLLAAAKDAPVPPPSEIGVIYQGALGPSRRVLLDLRFAGDEEGQEAIDGGLEGFGSGGALELDGARDSLGLHFDQADLDAEAFTGHWEARIEGDSLRGIWSNPDSATTYPFALARAGRTLEWVSDAPDLSLDYPEIERGNDPTRAALNARILEAATAAWRAEWKALSALPEIDAGDEEEAAAPYSELSLSIEALGEGTASLLLSRSEWSGGDAADLSLEPLNLVWRDGAWQRFDLASLARPGADLATRLEQLCLRELEATGASVIGGDPSTAIRAQFASLTLTPRGIRLHFTGDAVVADSEEPFELDVPYEDLLDLLDPSGPAAPFLR
ncbi:MAG: hypothetical protein U0527_17725 [Candidatus Eisenbacteria bacterium]